MWEWSYQYFIMIEEIKYFFLGIIQGLTEFFPISSSGHIELYSNLLSVSKEHPILVVITVHFATALSTIFVYRHRIKKLSYGILFNRNKEDILFIFKLAISTIPIILVYLLLNQYIDLIFNNRISLVCIMLIVTGIILISTSFVKSSNKEINFWHALFMGLGQAVAILPGISRSGSTIAIALFCNVNRKKAAEFAFLMALAPIIGGAIVQFLDSGGGLQRESYNGLIIAFFSAFFSGLFACKYMIHIVHKNNLKYFGYYCIIIGLGYFTYLLL